MPNLRPFLAGLLALAVAGCSDSPTEGGAAPPAFPDLTCSISTADLLDGGVGIDGIPSIEGGDFVSHNDPGADYLTSSDRVMGFLLDSGPVAIPHNILWWHEIVNLELDDGTRIAVTYCPLTGSSMVFDRAPAGGATLGVSGLLFRSNLVMYDRNEPLSLWPQMSREAKCGVADGTPLPMLPTVEMTWGKWRALHPGTLVMSDEQGFFRDYQLYPYGDYERLDNARTLVPLGGNLDRRRPPKERVLGIPTFQGGGIAFPFLALDEMGARAVVHPEQEADEVVIFWDRSAEGAMAYAPRADGMELTFESDGSRIVDRETGTTWLIDGRADVGPLAGARLEPINDAYVAFWFAWADFHPETELWLP